MLSELDTRSKLIDPKLKDAGWDEDLINREYPISAGRIEVIGETTRRASPKKADYVLRFVPNGEAIAIVEAKQQDKSAGHGMSQAKEYAEKLGILFVYSSNGEGIEEFDYVTNKQSSLTHFPTPEELRNRYTQAILKNAVSKEKTEKILEEPYYFTPSFNLRYYQETAVNRVIEKITEGDKRLLITLATGTGKTVIAFNIIWRLIKSNYSKRVLFIGDRNFLKGQAYNSFAPLGELRGMIEEGKAPKHNQVYFGIYQALYSPTPDGKRLFEEYPENFFDLIVIDECHRSGFGTWHDILDHFSSAVHLGMTATPKRADNIDTYKYFGEPIYTYSFGQGVQDGYLAPFILHRILTNIDKDGKVEIEDAKSKGAEVFIPVDEESQDVYSQREFERKVTLPDRTHEIAKHLAKFLRTFDPMAKTMVFCVDSDHAELMAKELQNEFADLGFSNYAVPIIARTGEINEGEYERFKDPEKSTPVVATTVDLLTTGIDVPSVRNIVIVKPIGSKIVFKQIIGRGARLDPSTGKQFFRIIDYIGASKLFDDWERVPEPKVEEPEGPADYFISGMVIDEDSQEPIPGTTVTLQRAINQQLYEKTDRDGRFNFVQLPFNKYSITIRATGYKSRSISLEPKENPNELTVIELASQGKKPKKVLVTGLPIHIAEEERLVLEKEGKTLNVEEYIEYSGKEVVKQVKHAEDLRTIWLDPNSRHEFLKELEDRSVYPDALAEVMNRPDLDQYDILSNAAFGSVPLTRDERMESLLNTQQKFLNSFSDDAKEVISALLEKYRFGGIEEIENPVVFELAPFDRLGRLEGVKHIFGDVSKLKNAVDSVRTRLYANAR